jgi:hypothetical protein
LLTIPKRPLGLKRRKEVFKGFAALDLATKVTFALKG